MLNLPYTAVVTRPVSQLESCAHQQRIACVSLVGLWVNNLVQSCTSNTLEVFISGHRRIKNMAIIVQISFMNPNQQGDSFIKY